MLYITKPYLANKNWLRVSDFQVLVFEHAITRHPVFSGSLDVATCQRC